jgi:hypothetical protein
VGKRVTFFLVIILISGLAVLGYFLQQGRRVLLTDPYTAVSPSACIVIETIDFQSFINALTTNSGLIGEIEKISEFKVFNNKVKYLADQLNKSPFKKVMTGTSSVIAFHFSDSRLTPILSMAVSHGVRIRQLKEILKSSGINKVNEKYLDRKSYLALPYTLNNIHDTAYISVISGLLLCTSSEKILKEAIYQTSRDNDIRTTPGFSKVLQASGKNEDKIFFVFDNLKELFNSIFRKDASLISASTDKLATCAEGDIFLSDNGLILSGYTESTDSTKILDKFKYCTPEIFHTYKILPSATVLFESVVREKGKPSYLNKEQISPEASDLADKLREFIGNEVTKAYVDIKERPVSENTLIIYELNNRVYAEKIFLDFFGAGTDKNNIFLFRPDDQISIPVYLTPYKGFASAIIPGFGDGFDDSYFAFYDNYLVTGNSNATISRFLYDNLLNKTLANDLTFRDFESTLPSISGYFFYCVPSRIIGYLARYLNEDIIKALNSNKNALTKIQAFGYQFAPSNEMIYNSVSVQYKDVARVEAGTEWETLLDTVAAIKPFFFTNHITGAKEIFIQDMKNNAYLINAAGRVLWKVPLREHINGSVYMIDYYRNGKYQLLFSGRNYLYLLDRNGNYVERYPIKLRSPATNSLALFDYDNNRDYRLLIAGEDKMIYAYDKSGSTVKGWKPFRTNGIVNTEISWFRVSGKDYLVTSDESSVYFTDRTGNKRLTLKEPVSRAKRSEIRLTPGNDPSVVCTAPDGTIQHIYFDGSVKKYSLKTFSVDHSFDIFDINGDGFGEYIFIDKGILYLYDHNRAEIFTRKFGSDELGGPINFIFSASDRKIGVFDVDKKLIYLIDGNGNIMKGFPLRGASMFSIGKLSDNGSWHLIVGGTDRFLYNYKLDTDFN